LEDFPDSEQGDEYKINIIKAYFKYAQMSVPTKQEERFNKVIQECADFGDRFPDSKLKSQVANYKIQSLNTIKQLKDEQAKATTQL
jgi:outer membrane protein assembly factor BamD